MEDKLYLLSSSRCFSKMNPALKSYVIEPDNVDYEYFDDWKPVLFEITEQLIQGYTAIVDYTYVPKKKYKKRILFSDRMPEYHQDGFCEKLMKKVVDDNLSWYFYKKEYRSKKKWEQKFYLINHHPDLRFIEMTYPDGDLASTHGLGTNGGAYRQDRLKQKGSMEEMIKDYEQAESGAIYFGIDGVEPGISICIDPYQVSIKELIKKMQTVCEKHKITLEVKI